MASDLLECKASPTGAGHTNRALTHQLDLGERGLAVNASEEQWKPVVGYEGFYEVSDKGRVRSLTRVVQTRLGHSTTYQGRILRQHARPTGHLDVGLMRSGHRVTAKVHRLVLTAFVGPDPEGMECCHNNGNPADNRVENLRWDTTAANRRDCVNHGNNLNAAKTHCFRGHPFTPDNVYTVRLPHRVCKTCARDRSRNQRAARSGQQ